MCDDPSVAQLSVSKPTSTVFPKVDAGECINTHQSVDTSSSTKSCTVAADDVQLIGSHCKQTSSKPVSQRKKIRKTMPSVEELDKILSGDKLTDYSINWACNLLKQQLTKVKGLYLTLLQRKKHNGKFVKDNIEIIYIRDNHWIVATIMMCRNYETLVCDSVFNFLDDDTVGIIRNLFVVTISRCLNTKHNMV